MSFTATDVKNLRELTGVGIMDCKSALTATDGDQTAAIEWLREKGLAAAQKKAGRITAEGMSFATVKDGVGVIVEVNAETDFVSKNSVFIDFVSGIADVIADRAPDSAEALSEMKYPGGDMTVEQVLREKILVIGENINIRRFVRYSGGLCVPYIHMGGRIGVLVNIRLSDNIKNTAEAAELGKDLAMQIAAMNPAFLDASDVDAATLEKERAILTAQAKEDPKNAGKPENIIAKMVDGRIGKFLKDNCLLRQDYVKGDKISVGQHIKAISGALGGSIEVIAFTRYVTGEGIEKKQDDFAAEVAGMVN